jgi:hypothetical protein
LANSAHKKKVNNEPALGLFAKLRRRSTGAFGERALLKF